jgi:hypothetical protein
MFCFVSVVPLAGGFAFWKVVVFWLNFVDLVSISGNRGVIPLHKKIYVVLRTTQKR